MTDAITDPDKLDIISAVHRKPYVDAVVVTEDNMEAVAAWVHRMGFSAEVTEFLGERYIDIEDPHNEHMSLPAYPGTVVVRGEDELVATYVSEDVFYEFYDWL